MLERYARTAAQLAEPLGLDPRSRVELEKLMADAGRSRFDLARALMDDDDEPA
jgi:phage terminase small subunit